jgi:glutathione S-transferase
MAVKLHRCAATWAKVGGHPCWRVQKALDEQGIEYEVVKEPFRPGKREELERLSGQRRLPVIEFEDGSAYRDESAAMAERIGAGRLFEGSGGASPSA